MIHISYIILFNPFFDELFGLKSPSVWKLLRIQMAVNDSSSMRYAPYTLHYYSFPPPVVLSA